MTLLCKYLTISIYSNFKLEDFNACNYLQKKLRIKAELDIHIRSTVDIGFVKRICSY